ncbi:MAG: TVP38/TMEM64 family protein [Campylobacterota bacterium]
MELFIVFVIMIVQVIIPPIPAELVVIGAGNLYGIWTATWVSGSGLFVGGILAYFFGRGIGKVFHNLFAKKKVAQVISRLHEVETFILLVRILPYNPSDIISYAAGVIRIPLKKYLLITFFVSYVRCFLLAYFGSKITSLNTLFIVFSLLFLSALIGYIIVFKRGKSDKKRSKGYK